MNGSGLETAASGPFSDHFKVASNDALVPQDAADLFIAVYRNGSAAGRLDGWRITGKQFTSERALRLRAAHPHRRK